MVLLRRWLNRGIGRGPWRIAPFEEIRCQRAGYAAGVHRAEDFTGVVECAPGEITPYGAADALLGQPPTWEELSGGPRYREQGIAFGEPKLLFSLMDACVAGTEGLVYCPHARAAVAETVRRWTEPAIEHPFLRAPGYPGPQELPGRTLCLLTLSGEGFYHFLLEVIPRLHLAANWLGEVDHVLANGAAGGFHERWLVQAGVPREKIVWAEGFAHFRCEQLLFTSHLMRDQQPSHWTVTALRTQLRFTPALEVTAKIWISRGDANIRRLAWENEIVSQLPGFELVELTRLAPSEQIKLFSRCRAVAGAHGAGLAQVAFCPPGAHLFEIFPHPSRQPIYHRLASLAGVHYHWAMLDFARQERLPELGARIRAALASDEHPHP